MLQGPPEVSSVTFVVNLCYTQKNFACEPGFNVPVLDYDLICIRISFTPASVPVVVDVGP